MGSWETPTARYQPAFTWSKPVDTFIRELIREKPLLVVCSGLTDFGTVRMDIDPSTNPDVVGDINEALPFSDDSFSAVFADPPWNLAYRKQIANFFDEAFRVAPVLYVMSPWVNFSSRTPPPALWYRYFPGIHLPILLSRYERYNHG